MIAPAILKQSAIKVALYGLDEADLGHLYSWRQGLSMDDLPTKGCAFVGQNGTVRPMKTWFLEPDQIRTAALAIARIRPDLDAAGAEVADTEYEIDMGGRRPVTMTASTPAGTTGCARRSPAKPSTPPPAPRLPRRPRPSRPIRPHRPTCG